MYLKIMCRVVKNGTKLHLFTARDCKLVDPLSQCSFKKPLKFTLSFLCILAGGPEDPRRPLCDPGSSDILCFVLRSMTGAKTWAAGRGLVGPTLRAPGWLSGMVLAAAFFNWMCDCINLTPFDQPKATVAEGAPNSSSS